MGRWGAAVWIVGSWWCTACADPFPALPVDPSPAAPDASSQTPAEASAPEATGPLPASPSAFRTRLARGQCYGDCPVYEVSIDERGHVEYAGDYCTALPGVFTREAEPGAARALYDALRTAGYGALSTRYDSADTCPELWTDGSTSKWTVEADGISKSVTRYQGCKGVPELAPLDALEDDVSTTSGISPWLEGPFNCSYQTDDTGDYTLRVSHAGSALGVLHVESSGSFSFHACDGEELARGDTVVDRLDAESMRLIMVASPRGPITLPALGDVGSLVLRVPAPVLASSPGAGEALGLTGLRIDGSLPLMVSAADDCG